MSTLVSKCHCTGTRGENPLISVRAERGEIRDCKGTIIKAASITTDTTPQVNSCQVVGAVLMPRAIVFFFLGFCSGGLPLTIKSINVYRKIMSGRIMQDSKKNEEDA